MTFIVTAEGAEMDTRFPQPGQFTAGSTAWALSQLNRFAGHARRPYSVAEHSLLVCEIVEREFGLNVYGQLAALLHDAHEPYCGADLPSPHKAEIGLPWRQWEERWLRRVRSAFAVSTVFVAHGQDIRIADLMALATEKRDLMPATPTPWSALAGTQPIGWVRLNSPERMAATWEDWRDRWLDKYHELDYARNSHSFPVHQP